MYQEELSRQISHINYGYKSMNAKEMTCRAPRGDIHATACYEDVSDDDTVFDIYDEIEWIQIHEESVLDFELDYLDEISIEHHIDGMDGNVQTDHVETSLAVNDGEIRNDK